MTANRKIFTKVFFATLIITIPSFIGDSFFRILATAVAFSTAMIIGYMLLKKHSADMEDKLQQDKEQQEWIPLRHYYHRHTRSFFWEMEQIIPFGNQPWFRYLLGWMSPPDISLLKLTETDAIHELYDAHHMDQDFLVPISTMDASLSYFHHQVNYYL